MKKLGLVFACFDFIVDVRGQYYFLELNEAGQFLWIEEINPDFKMLTAFVRLLLSQSLHLNIAVDDLPMAKFKQDVEKENAQRIRAHINTPM